MEIQIQIKGKDFAGKEIIWWETFQWVNDFQNWTDEKRIKSIESAFRKFGWKAIAFRYLAKYRTVKIKK